MSKPVLQLTEYARAGFDGNPNPHLSSSPAWFAHALGRHLHYDGHSVPKDVRMGRGDSIRACGMRFKFQYAAGLVRFTRVFE